MTVSGADVTARVLLDGILAEVGEAASEPGSVELVGADPILQSPLRLGEAGAATIAASGEMAARLWAMRTGRRQTVRVEVDAAAAAMRSSRYVRVLPAGEAARVGGAGAQASGAGAPASAAGDQAPDFQPRAAQGGLGVYPTRDGRWVYLHRTFPHHRARIHALLECADDEASVAAAVRRWDALALEEAIYAAGACGVVVRTGAEWQAHAQARALAQLPLLEILRIGDSPPRPFAPEGRRPLAGVRVLDLTRVLAGPTCGRTLAEHGADVLRVGTPRVPDDVGMMRDTGHGKRSTALELTDASDASRLRELVSEADVFVQGYRPGAIAALGFGPVELSLLRPGLVYLQLSAFGHVGPWAARRGFDSVVQAVSGIAEEHAKDGVPHFTPANPLDYMTGYLAAFGIMVALGRRAREGGSYLVRLSLAQTGRWVASLPRVPAERLRSVAVDLTPERLAGLMMESDSPFGRLRHLAPIAQLSETPAQWTLPTVPLEHDPAHWW